MCTARQSDLHDKRCLLMQDPNTDTMGSEYTKIQAAPDMCFAAAHFASNNGNKRSTRANRKIDISPTRIGTHAQKTLLVAFNCAGHRIVCFYDRGCRPAVRRLTLFSHPTISCRALLETTCHRRKQVLLMVPTRSQPRSCARVESTVMILVGLKNSKLMRVD
jgi:hypothetical protein